MYYSLEVTCTTLPEGTLEESPQAWLIGVMKPMTFQELPYIIKGICNKVQKEMFCMMKHDEILYVSPT